MPYEAHRGLWHRAGRIETRKRCSLQDLPAPDVTVPELFSQEWTVASGISSCRICWAYVLWSGACNTVFSMKFLAVSGIMVSSQNIVSATEHCGLGENVCSLFQGVPSFRLQEPSVCTLLATFKCVQLNSLRTTLMCYQNSIAITSYWNKASESTKNSDGC